MNRPSHVDFPHSDEAPQRGPSLALAVLACWCRCASRWLRRTERIGGPLSLPQPPTETRVVRWTTAAASVLALGAVPRLRAQSVDYLRAEALLDWNLTRNVFGDKVIVHWLPGSDRFWYYVAAPAGPSFVRVDPVANVQAPLFDARKLVAAMSVAAGLAFDSAGMGSTDVTVLPGEHFIDVDTMRRRFHCDIVAYTCRVRQLGGTPMLRSPNGQWDAFVTGNNVYIRPVDGGDSIPLTHDGEDLWSYGYGYNTAPHVLRLRAHGRGQPAMQWSPDSRFLAVQRWDARGVKLMPLYSSTTTRPTLYLYPTALPGDSVTETYTIVVIDVAARSAIPVQNSATPFIQGVTITGGTPERNAVKWSSRSDTLYFVTGSRGAHRLTLIAADPRTGRSRDVLGDTSSTTTLETSSLMQPEWQVVNGGRDIFWFSWRDGWGHFYRFDQTGRLQNRLTSGPWTVERIVHVDGRRRQVYFTARGREPARFLYHAYLYRVNFDGTGVTLLTPEDGDHVISFAPRGRFFVDTYSRMDQPPITVLRCANDGRVLRTLVRADVSRLAAAHWTPPRLLRMTAADGVTDIYGLMYTPTDFDSTRKYPLVDHVYPGPSGPIREWGFKVADGVDFSSPRALAELGFVVVEIVGRGTWMRSKAFFDAYTGHIGANTLPDQVAGIRELAQRYPFIDSTRVGIYGFSGGGYAAAAAMLRYPDVFKVGVAMSGNHDNRTFAAFWGERYQGLYQQDTVTGKDNYEAEANYTFAGNLTGKLLLMHGDLDEVHPAMTLRLVYALIAARKKFDMMIFPDRGHIDVPRDGYTTTLVFDYFVRYLKNAMPPAAYVFRSPGEGSP